MTAKEINMKDKIVNCLKNFSMRYKNIWTKAILLLLLTAGATTAIAQGPYPNTGDHVVCLNAVEPYGVVLHAGSTYSWAVTPLAGGNGTITNGATPNLITVSWTTVGTATLRVTETNAQGCPGDPVTINVTVNPLPTLLISNPSVCAPSTVDLTSPAVTAGSTAGVTLTYWSDASATIPYTTPTAATSGTYYIKATGAGGCSIIRPVIVTITASPTLTITNPPGLCGVLTADLTAATVTAGSTPGLVLTYWTDAAATIPYATPIAAPTGTYYIKGSLSGGCSDIKPVTVTANVQPVPLVTGPSPVCETISGSTATYSTPAIAGHTYSWTVIGGTIATGQGTNLITVTWTAPGTGSVSVTEAIIAGGCSATVLKTITVTAKPTTSPITHN